MKLERSEARRRLEKAPVARLATVRPDGRPHAVPICFVLTGDTIYSAVDDKPKRSPQLQRLANVAASQAAAVLIDRYDDDWTTLWWVRADGSAREVGEATERERAVAALRSKYPQYVNHRLADALLAIDIASITGWAASPDTHPAPGR